MVSEGLAHQLITVSQGTASEAQMVATHGSALGGSEEIRTHDRNGTIFNTNPQHQRVGPKNRTCRGHDVGAQTCLLSRVTRSTKSVFAQLIVCLTVEKGNALVGCYKAVPLLWREHALPPKEVVRSS